MTEVAALILAGGKGTRMKSSLCKVLHLVAGKPMVSYVIDAVRSSGLKKIVMVVGHQAPDVIKKFQNEAIEFAIQEPQLGTGHAVAAARDLFRGFEGHVLIICGDIPLIRPETLTSFLNFHAKNLSSLTVMTTFLETPNGYGRIIRDESNKVVAIVEEKDATEDQKSLKEINTGIYVVQAQTLFRLIEKIGSSNAQSEYYLTDIVSGAIEESIDVYAFVLEDAQEATGINNRAELARASAVIWDRLRSDFMDSGVTLLDPQTIYIDSLVKIGKDTVIHPVVHLTGKTEIGENCLIESGVYIIDSWVGDNVKILQGSRLNGAVVQDGTSVGPMAHLRPETKIGKNARIGNFVEVKKSSVGDGSKASHLTYLGDSTVGKNVNIGCGTITCNYDGQKKHQTIIGDECFIGSDVQFVAPVEIGDGSLIGAGSTITKNVPPKSLAVARSKQKVFPLRKGQGPSSKKD